MSDDDLATGPYQHCRPLTDDEYAALKSDIEAHGVMEYVHVDENGAILVGHHRARAAAELGIEYPRHVVTGLSEREKHEYAVRLESLGRAKDIETKQWTALHLWHAKLGINQKHLATLVGVAPKTISVWVKEAEARLQEEKNYQGNSSRNEPERVKDARGRSMPTTYQPRQPKPKTEPEPEREPPTVAGDVRSEVAAAMDDAGVDEAVELNDRRKWSRGVRAGWLRLASEHTPGELIEGLGSDEIGEVIESVDRFVGWLQQVREVAVKRRRPRGV